MDLMTLKGNDLYLAFIAGARKLIGKKDHLNKINVFPVPDGDTGTNMSYLMQTIINEAKPSDDLSLTMDSIANAAITGSRGNSGIIISEYFNGLSEKLKGKKQAGIQDFKEAVTHAVNKAYEALMNPVEGTILTVLRKAFNILDHHDSFNSYFKTSLQQAKIALAETTEELEVLKQNKVVDAGAEGFTAFLEGINYYLDTGDAEVPVAQAEVERDLDVHDMVVTERYCTEALLINVNRTADDLRALFNEDGSSLIVSGKQEKMRIHIHTDHPDLFFLKLRNYGQILDQKVDDMIRQQQSLLPDRPKIALVTDTIADIPEEFLDKYNIHQLPMSLMVDDVSYIDRFSISTDTFYELLKKAKSFSSAQPDKRTIERTFDFLSDHYDQILAITVSSKMSVTYNALIQYQKTNPKLTVFDSRQNSGSQGLIVLNAARLIASGAAMAKVIEVLENVAQRTKIFVSVKTLKYMVKQGRVSKVTGLAAKIMNLKPVISIDGEGKGIIKEKALSLRKNQKQIIKLIKEHPLEEYVVVHALDPERALKLANRIEEATGKKAAYITQISPIVAMNAGIGAVAAACVYQEEA
ncbi:MAG: DegV family protein [Candidatus Izemoplasmatales bacterium]|jgi:hypothetical protein